MTTQDQQLRARAAHLERLVAAYREQAGSYWRALADARERYEDGVCAENVVDLLMFDMGLLREPEKAPMSADGGSVSACDLCFGTKRVHIDGWGTDCCWDCVPERWGAIR